MHLVRYDEYHEYTMCGKCCFSTDQLRTRFQGHVHLIPRRDGDVVDPKGGVRGVIPSKQKY